MTETIININNLYRLLDVLNILFLPDNPLRVNLVREINILLDDLEKSVREAEALDNDNSHELFDKR